MALLVVFGILTGAVLVMVLAKVTRLWELFILSGWGVLAAVVVVNGDLAEFWGAVTSWTG